MNRLDYGGANAIKTFEMHAATYEKRDLSIAEFNFDGCEIEVARLKKTSSMEKFLTLVAKAFQAFGLLGIYKKVCAHVLGLQDCRNHKLQCAKSDLLKLTLLVEKLGGSIDKFEAL